MYKLRGFRQALMAICIGVNIFLMCSCSNNQNENILPNNTQEILQTIEPDQTATNKPEQTASSNQEQLLTNAQKKTDKSSSIGDKIIGVWHASPSVGAGYSNVFFFHKDSKFNLFYSQYDEEKRTLDISGKWSIVEDKLILSISQKTIVVGGELEEASPSSTSKYCIVNGTIQKIKLNTPETIKYSLGEIEKATDSPYENKLTLNKESYWKISDDPDDEFFKKQFTIDETSQNKDPNLENDDLNKTDNKFETYINGRYGFSIKYPIAWKISEESPSGDGVVLYNKEKDDVRVYGGYLLGDDTDTMAVDKAKEDGLKVDEFNTDSRKKGYKIIEKNGDRVILHVVVYGKGTHSHLYADTSAAFYKENEFLLIDLAKSINLKD